MIHQADNRQARIATVGNDLIVRREQRAVPSRMAAEAERNAHPFCAATDHFLGLGGSEQNSISAGINSPAILQAANGADCGSLHSAAEHQERESIEKPRNLM